MNTPTPTTNNLKFTIGNQTISIYGPRAVMPVPGSLSHVTGDPDSGKTTFALSAGAHPGRTVVFDDDIKGRVQAMQAEAAGTPYAGYVNLVGLRKGLKSAEYYTKVMEIVNRLPDNELDLIVFDGWTAFGLACRDYVATHETEFKTKWAPNTQIRNGEHASEGRKLEARVMDTLLTKAVMVIITTHLKDEYQGNVATGRKVADCTAAVTQKSQLRIWLRHGDDGSPEPTGLVLKRLSVNHWTENGMETLNVLPRKVTHCTWATIRGFLKNPVGNAIPTAEQMPNEFELSILDGILTPDQREAMRLSTQAYNAERAAALMVGQAEINPAQVITASPQLVLIRTKAESGMTPEQIAKDLGLPMLIVTSALATANSD